MINPESFFKNAEVPINIFKVNIKIYILADKAMTISPKNYFSVTNIQYNNFIQNVAKLNLFILKYRTYNQNLKISTILKISHFLKNLMYTRNLLIE